MISEATMEDGCAVVTVRFEADIAAVTRNSEGQVVAGSLSDAVQTRDRGPSAATSLRAIPTGC